MKKTLLFLSISTVLFIGIIGLFVSCDENPQKAAESETTEKTALEESYLSLANFDVEAAKFVDQEIQIKGIVDHICKHGGKRLFLVDDFGDVHIDGNERFDDALAGSEVVVTGIIKELRVDEAYCLKMEEDQIQKHKEGVGSEDVHKQKMEQVKQYRDSMQTAQTDHISFYSIEYVSHIVK